MPASPKKAGADKIKGCFLLGACGDTLGAPLEEIRSLDRILEKCGPAGLSEILPFDNVFGTGISYLPGRLTDDTTMTMTTAAAMVLAKNPSDWEEIKPLLWQGYINWCAPQEGAGAVAAKIDKTIDWGDEAPKFWIFCGAGAGTIAALQQDQPGSIETPLTYDCVVRGKRVQGPNAGCGGMMRVAPQALLDLPAERIFELGCANGALTHGHPDAFVATGITALLTHFAAQDLDMPEALTETRRVLAGFAARAEYKSGIANCLAALDAAETRAAEKPGDLHAMDALPREIGYKNPFLAVPVLAQTIYALLSAPALPDRNGIKAAMAVAVSHSGDSDSVGAIVGNVLGARHGAGVIPKEWLDVLIQKKDIEKIASDFHAALNPAQPRPNAPKAAKFRP